MKIKQIILVFTLSSLFVSCSVPDLCEDVVETEVSSNEYTATIYTRGCGATTRDYPYLNVRKVNETFDREDRKKQVVLSLKHQGVKANWKDGSTLVVECENCLEDDLNKANQEVNKRFQDLKIEYQSKQLSQK